MKTVVDLVFCFYKEYSTVPVLLFWTGVFHVLHIKKTKLAYLFLVSIVSGSVVYLHHKHIQRNVQEEQIAYGSTNSRPRKTKIKKIK